MHHLAKYIVPPGDNAATKGIMEILFHASHTLLMHLHIFVFSLLSLFLFSPFYFILFSFLKKTQTKIFENYKN